MKFSFKHYNNIDQAYFRTDFHMHSNWTDGKQTIAEMVDQAKKISLTDIAITDHIREKSTYFTKYYKEILDIRRDENINIFIGYESKVKNFLGEIDVSEEVKNKAEVRIVSVHNFPIGRKLISPKIFNIKTCQDIELELSIAAINNRSNEFDIIGHPGGMSIKFHGEFPLDYFKEIIIGCSKEGIAFDINHAYHYSIINQIKSLLTKYNPLVSIGSDAHISGKVGSWISDRNEYL